MPETLTKSRFVLGVSCPQKLVYRRDSSYRNLRNDDSFLESLAEGGFQVGEFAKAHFPGGHDIETLDSERALSETNELLTKHTVTIFEAAVRWQNCFIRIDVLEKKGPFLRIHEVKAKSFSSAGEQPFQKRDGSILAEWQPYLYDVAFQKYVTQNAFPDTNVTAFLMLIDKAAESPIDGLNQYYEIRTSNGRTGCHQVKEIPQGVLDAKILKSVPVDLLCNDIYEATRHGSRLVGSFDQVVSELSDICEENATPVPVLIAACGSCEFQKSSEDDPLKSGFEACVQACTGAPPAKGEPLIFDLWNFRGKDKALEAGLIRLTELEDEDIGQPNPYRSGAGLNPAQRRKLQVDKAKASDSSPWFDKAGWLEERSGWSYPLHFIDFETTRVALPFFEGQHPYQTVAFQFSHHTIDEFGKVKHATQFLNTNSQNNPNASFVRSLRDALSEDDGTIFMYTPHENTTLRDIYYELAHSYEKDAAELRDFLREIVTPQRDSVESWTPSRAMVDQCELVKKYLFLPRTGGSNSLKYVLPAMLEASEYLRTRYENPIYGRGCPSPSLNLGPTALVEFDANGEVKNPYRLLPDLTVGLSPDEQEELRGLETITEGGAALTAYARLMNANLSAGLRKELETALLRYCELDTLAMVLLHEGMRELPNNL